MLGLFIAAGAATIVALAAIIAIMAWAIRREDACLTMTGPAPTRTTRVVRGMLGVYTTGLSGPVQAHPPVRRTGTQKFDDLDLPDPLTAEPV